MKHLDCGHADDDGMDWPWNPGGRCCGECWERQCGDEFWVFVNCMSAVLVEAMSGHHADLEHSLAILDDEGADA